MSNGTTFAAVDLGASSGRVMLAEVNEAGVDLREVHRFPNCPVTIADTLFPAIRWPGEVIGPLVPRRCRDRAAGDDRGSTDSELRATLPDPS